MSDVSGIHETECRELELDLAYLRNLLRITIQEGRNIKEELGLFSEQIGTKVDYKNTLDVIRFINEAKLSDRTIEGRSLTHETLDELYAQTNNLFFVKLKNYKRFRDKYKKIAAFIKSFEKHFNENDYGSVRSFLNAPIEWMTLKIWFKQNQAGQSVIAKPAFPFTVEETRLLLGFRVAIRIENEEGVAELCKKYESIIWGSEEEIEMLYLGNVLYLKMFLNGYEVIPFFDIEAEDKMRQLIEEFRKEYRDQWIVQ
ncbi:hypothetical protein VQ056_23040 [Paenibacillus sp. JTLBN-2024]